MFVLILNTASMFVLCPSSCYKIWSPLSWEHLFESIGYPHCVTICVVCLTYLFIVIPGCYCIVALHPSICSWCHEYWRWCGNICLFISKTWWLISRTKIQIWMTFNRCVCREIPKLLHVTLCIWLVVLFFDAISVCHVWFYEALSGFRCFSSTTSCFLVSRSSRGTCLQLCENMHIA